MSRIRKFGSAILNTLDNMAIASHDGASRDRIREIDAELAQLRMERDYLIANLYEPRTDEVVSNDYVPGAYRPQPKPSPSEGRLTPCKGQWADNAAYHDAHPGCPYLGKKHNAHEFTLRD